MCQAASSSTFELLSNLHEWSMVAPLHVDNFFIEIIKIDNAARELVLSNISKICVARESGQLLLTFRGDNKKALGDRLFKKKVTETDAYITLFYLGEKSKHFYKNSCASLQRLQHFKHIADESADTFSYVFRRMSYALSLENYRTSNQKKAVKRFINKNIQFCEFFTKALNEKCFVSKCTVEPQLGTSIRDYYLYLLHTFGRMGISDLSFFVSSSRNYEQALSFTKESKADSSPIVFVYFIPYPFANYGIDLKIILETNEAITKRGLPIYTSDLYPKQEEFCVKGGLFPHFLLGVLEPDVRRFVVNYHLFNDENSDTSVNITRGFCVNQSDFLTLLRKSGYVGYLTRHWSGAYQSEII